MRKARIAYGLAAATLAFAACSPVHRATVAASPSRDAEPITAELAAATFDTAWSTVYTTYYDSTFRGIDWLAEREKRRPYAAASRTLGDLRRFISDLVQRMGESHFGVIPAEAAEAVESLSADDPEGEAGDAGLDFRIAGDEALVWRVDSTGPAFRSGVRMGWKLESVKGVDITRRVAVAASLSEPVARRAALFRVTRLAAHRFAGAAGDTVRATFRDGPGSRRSLAMILRPQQAEMNAFGNLPPQPVTSSFKRMPSAGSCLGYITFNIWLTPIVRFFDEAMDNVRDCRGIIVDLRGNPGGAAGMAMGIAGYFVDSVVPLGILRTRSTTLRFVTSPRRVTNAGRAIRPFAGPVAILLDEMSASTTEIFAAGMQYIGRARVFGTTTAMQALPALLKRLPTGDVLMHVYADYTAPDGTRLEGRGVIPDHIVPLSRAELLAGRDVPLEAAVQWIDNSLRSR